MKWFADSRPRRSRQVLRELRLWSAAARLGNLHQRAAIPGRSRVSGLLDSIAAGGQSRSTYRTQARVVLRLRRKLVDSAFIRHTAMYGSAV